MIPDPRTGQSRPGSEVLLGSAPSLDSLFQCCAVLPVNHCSEPLRSSLWSCISPFATSQKSFALSSFYLPFQVVWPLHCQTKPLHLLQPLPPVVFPQTPASLETFLLCNFFLNCEAQKAICNIQETSLELIREEPLLIFIFWTQLRTYPRVRTHC